MVHTLGLAVRGSLVVAGLSAYEGLKHEWFDKKH